MGLTDVRAAGTFGIVARAAKKAEAGEKVTSLAIGEPGYDTPSEIIEAAASAMREGYTHYGPSQGLPSFRRAAAEKVRRKNQIECGEEHIAFMASKMAIYAAFLAVEREGRREVLLPDPGFFYSAPAQLAGLTPRYYGVRQDMSPDLDMMSQLAGPGTAAVVVNDPSNPTGRVLSEGDLKKVFGICSSTGAKLISDEAYEDFTYGKRHISPGSFEGTPDTVVSLFTLSKSYAMTGWRAGYVVAGEEVLSKMVRYIEQTYTCSPPFIQKASEFALKNCDRHVERFRDDFLAKKEYVESRAREIPGMEMSPVEGAFYAFPRYGIDMPSKDFSLALLEERNVAVFPGISFGSNGEGRFRISFSGNIEDIEHGMDEIGAFISGHKQGGSN